MVKLSTDSQPKYEISDYELERKKIVFSADLLLSFKKDHPKDEICVRGRLRIFR